MPRERTDESGGAPFKPDNLRGLWDSPGDFLFSSVCNVFRLDILFIVVIVFEIFKGGVFGLFMLLASIVFYAVPITFIQIFLGQFSGTGFMTAFRITPLFKGMAYIALGMNLTSVLCCGALTALSLMFLIQSMQSAPPWSCQERDQVVCQFNDTMTFSPVKNVFPLVACALLVCIAIAFLLDGRPGRIQMLGRLLRYTGVSVVVLLAVVLTHLMCETDVRQSLKHLVTEHFFAAQPSINDGTKIIFLPPLLINAFFGPGWGSIVSMASYNRFNTNSVGYSWLTCCIQAGVIGLFSLLFISSELLLTGSASTQITPNLVPFSRVIYALEAKKCSRLLPSMFLLSQFLGSFNLLVVQTLSVQTALLDEFESLRLHRRRLTLFILTIFTIVFACVCFLNGFGFLFKLSEFSLVSCGIMNLLLLLLVGWLYGRERLQRDVEFMTKQTITTWTVNLSRFVTPVFIILSLTTAGAVSFDCYIAKSPSALLAMSIAFLSWSALPVLALKRFNRTSGSIQLRLRECTSPSDWHPADTRDQQRSGSRMDNLQRTLPLTALKSDL